MLAKFWGAALAAGVMGLLAVSAPAAQAQPAAQPAAKKPMAEGKSTSHHKMSCYDYAWDSEQMKDCLARQKASNSAITDAEAKRACATESTGQ